ncbi:MAG TPA: CHAD domain-containing protein [Candidatus Sulfotelmatobacter sp.]|nr:CHAD domain-containing protein [Candidatus Sulfotelmatobacter sp.]
MPPPRTTGLRYWMERVLHECDQVSANFAADPVHDLRVALRRCRSMADGLHALDPHPDWRAMKKAGKRLFQRLGQLRDIQIMMDWIDRLEPKVADVARTPSSAELPHGPGVPHVSLLLRDVGSSTTATQREADRDPAAQALLHILRQREAEQKREAKAALEEFDRKQWRHWSRSLPTRAAHIRPGNALFKHLALERWMAARELHSRALRVRSQVAWHSLRIGIKRFRYIVENFLPEEHKLWSNDLKRIQDALGEVHDLDVLWATAISSRVFADQDSRQRWHAVILEERTKRIDLYRSRMVGPNSLWNIWRERLPEGKQIQSLALRRLKLWARVLDPDFAHSEHVAKLALELYDGLHAAHLVSPDGIDARASLFHAALLHDVGKSESKKGHHKHSLELIQAHGAIPGWSQKDMQRAAVLARFHCGALPSRGHRLLRDLLPNEQKAMLQMAGVLRLANALDISHDRRVQRVTVENNGRKIGLGECVVIAAQGYSPRGTTAQTVAAERYLLENVLRRPVMVKATATSIRSISRSTASVSARSQENKVKQK